jgi:hypothetical protein
VGNRGLRSVEWQHYPIDDDDVIHHLDGPYRLELELCEALKDWVHSMLTNTHGKLITIMGFYVSDQENTIWQIMEYSPRESRCYASVKFPSLSELIIQREDIEAFESQLAATGKRRTDVQVTEQKRTKQSDGAYLMEKYLDETPEGGLSGFVRFMKQAAGRGYCWRAAQMDRPPRQNARASTEFISEPAYTRQRKAERAITLVTH